MENDQAFFQQIDLDIPPRQYPNMREPLDPTSPYGRYMQALLDLGESFKNYCDLLAFINFNNREGVNIGFEGKTLDPEYLVEGTCFAFEGGGIVQVIKWGNHCLKLKEGEITLEGEHNRIVFDDENFFPIVIDSFTISNVSKYGVELEDAGNGVAGENTLTLDRLTEVINIVTEGIDKAYGFIGVGNRIRV